MRGSSARVRNDEIVSGADMGLLDRPLSKYTDVSRLLLLF